MFEIQHGLNFKHPIIKSILSNFFHYTRQTKHSDERQQSILYQEYIFKNYKYYLQLRGGYKKKKKFKSKSNKKSKNKPKKRKNKSKKRKLIK